MPYQSPTLDETFDRMLAVASTAQFRKRDGTTVTAGPVQPNSVLSVLVRLMAVAEHAAHRHVDAAMRDAVPITATGDALSNWGAALGEPRQPATFAQLEVVFTGTDGTVVPAGTQLQHVDSGQTYATAAAGTIAGGSVTIAANAANTGPDGNRASGTTLSVIPVIAGLDSTATTGEPLVVGVDEQTDEDLRAQIVATTSARPNGANDAFYVDAARSVPGVTRAWPVPDTGSAGHVFVYAVSDVLNPITLPASLVTAIENAIDPPVGTTPIVQSAALKSLDPSIQLSPNTPTVQESVTASLTEMLLQETAPGATLSISKIRQAISNAAGEEDHVLVSPAANVTTTAGEIIVLGTPVYSAIP